MSKQRNISEQQRTLRGPIEDKRELAAYNVYEEVKKGSALVYKTTRAGATTSIILESMNRMEHFLALVPTNAIAAKTIVEDIHKYSKLDNISIVRVVSNSHCLYNQELCKEYPDLKELKFLPIPEKCEGCKHFDICEITEVLRNNNPDGIVMTYAKLAALLMAARRDNSTAQTILDTLETSENLILDEVHEMQYGNQESIIVYNAAIGECWNLERYERLPEKEFKWIREVIKRLKLLKEDYDIKTLIHEVKGGAESANYYKLHLNRPVLNPCFEIGNERQNEAISLGVTKEIIELTKHRDIYNLSMEDIKRIYSMKSIAVGAFISISALKDHGVVQVSLSAIDGTQQNMINSYVMSMQTKTKRTLLTSATICSFDYGKLFMGRVRPKNILFGEAGDPLNTNSKMLILADHKKYNAIGENSRFKKKNEIVSRIIEILEAYDGKDIIIIAMGIKEAAKLEGLLETAGKPHEVTYYKSPDMMGVSSSARIMIAVGIANKPSNSFDVVTGNAEESKKLLYEAIACDTWQAWSRVKDPEGIENSLVFGLGCCVDDVKYCVEWGFNRKIEEIDDKRNGCRTKVKIGISGEEISKPQIILNKKFEEMLINAGIHVKQSKKFCKKSENRLCNIIDGFCNSDRKVYKVNTDFLEEIINRRDLFKLYNPDTGRYFDVKKPISEKDIKDHLSGKTTIGGYQIDNKTNLVKWICFDIDSHPKPEATEEEIKASIEKAEKQKEEMEAFLAKLKIPYVLELSGREHSYHYWIFLKPVDASAAYDFGRDIVKELGYKPNTDIEVFPKQKSIKPEEYGNFVKLPLGIKSGAKSRVYQGDKAVRKVTNLEIQYIDITGYQEFVSEKQKKAKKARGTAGPVKFNTVEIGAHKVRECLLRACNMPLHGQGDAGNITRVFIARELICAGMQPEEIAEYFKGQQDYNREKTLYHIGQVMKKELPPVPCYSIYEKIGNFIGCEQCPNFYRCGAEAPEIQIEV